jgi:hypothetical protein
MAKLELDWVMVVSFVAGCAWADFFSSFLSLPLFVLLRDGEEKLSY